MIRQKVFYKKLSFLFLFISFCISICCAGVNVYSQTDAPEKDIPIEVNADNIEYQKEAETVTGTGNVEINFKGVMLAADKITVNLVTKDAYADGNVRFYQGDKLYTAEHIFYNFDTEEALFKNAKGKFKPFYLHGATVKKQAKKAEYIVESGYITTSDYFLPDYKLKAKKVFIYPNDKVILKNIVLEVGNIPLLWVPYWYYPLTNKDAPFSCVPGYSKRFGFYLLNTAQIYNSKNLKIQLSADLRTKRGVAAGFDTEYNFDDQIKGIFKSYVMHDSDFDEYDRKITGEETRKNLSKKRYRFTWEHEQQIFDDTRLLAELNLQSDKQIVEDYFRREFHEQIQRTNFVDLTKATEQYQAELYVSPKFNSFFDVLERLPEVSFTKKNATVFGPPVFYQNDYRISNLRFKFDDENLDFDAFRLSTYNKFELPLFLWDFLNVTPYIEGRSALYSDMREHSKKGRYTFTGGVNSNFRISKIYNVQSDNWNIHGLRHIFEPTIDFKFVRSNLKPERVYQFDLIDSISHDTAFSFKFRNLLQTKRQREKRETVTLPGQKEQIVQHKGIEEVVNDLVDFSIYYDIFPTGAKRDTFSIGRENKEFNNLSVQEFFFRRNISLGTPFLASREEKNISELLFDIKFQPFDWLSSRFITRYDPHDRQLEEVTWGLTFFHTDQVSWDIYLSYFLGGSTQLNHTLS